MSIQIIGDEIHFYGELVAILTTGASPTLMGRFCDHLDEAVVPPSEDEEKTGDDPVANALDMLDAKAQLSARGGLLRLPDLSRIIAQVKEG